jgi:hypothetical protein
MGTDVRRREGREANASFFPSGDQLANVPSSGRQPTRMSQLA